jgi:uncharacterized phage infection (PIP) family protein YhgE
VTTRKLIRTAAVATFAALALAGVLAGCGSGSTTPSESPSTIYPESSPTGTLPALKAYLTDAQEVLGQVATTVGALPDATSGMSTKPDDTWSSAAAQLQSIATQLGDEAAALAALQPPSALKPVQDAVVKGIQAAQSGVEKLAAGLESGQQKTADRRAEVQAQVDQYKAQIDGLTQQLQNAISGLTGQ